MSALEPWLVLFTARAAGILLFSLKLKTWFKSFHRFDMIEVWYWKRELLPDLSIHTFGFKEPFEHLFTIQRENFVFLIYR